MRQYSSLCLSMIFLVKTSSGYKGLNSNPIRSGKACADVAFRRPITLQRRVSLLPRQRAFHSEVYMLLKQKFVRHDFSKVGLVEYNNEDDIAGFYIHLNLISFITSFNYVSPSSW